MFLDTKKPDQPAKPGFFTSILNDLGFLSKKDDPKIDPLKDDKPGTSAFQMFGGKTDTINQFDDVVYSEPEKKGIFSGLFDLLKKNNDDAGVLNETEINPIGLSVTPSRVNEGESISIT